VGPTGESNWSVGRGEGEGEREGGGRVCVSMRLCGCLPCGCVFYHVGVAAAHWVHAHTTPHHHTGSGKSSLLNALAGRVAFVKNAKLEGQVYLNGAAIDYALMPKICGACIYIYIRE
jgi:hypothetical protein